MDLEARSFRLPIALLSLLCLATVVFLFWRERGAVRPFRQHQLRHQQLRLEAGGAAAAAGVPLLPVEVGPDRDRCPSCHLGIVERPLRAGLRNPHRSHPGQLLVQHPPRRFGCTNCHGAGGDRSDRCLPAHPDADGRALGASRAQASCRGCHDEAESLPGAERLGAGLRAYGRLGCGGCHPARGLPSRRIGPPLDGVTTKLSPQYLRAFLLDPQQVRPGTAMPSFLSEEALAGAPQLSVGQGRQRRGERLEALLAFLAASPGPLPATPAPSPPVSAGTSLRTFQELGCPACHLAGASAASWQRQGLGGVGPDLGASRERLSRDWLLAWLAGPRELWPATRMPDFRLSAEERAELAASLAGPPRWPVPRPTPQQALSGRELAERLGCGGCHSSRALEGTPPSGPELDGFGDKRLELLDWGHSQVPVQQRSVWRWLELKLEQPLHFDRQPGVLTMPWQKLRRGEREGLILVLRSLAASDAAARAHPTEAVQQRRRGSQLVGELACGQCHALRPGDRAPLQALHPVPAEAPPGLDGEGGKVRPAWLHGFLRAPQPLRPWLKPRMPTPAATAEERQSLAAGLTLRDGASFPFDEEPAPRLQGDRLEEGLLLFERLQCLRCHLLSNAPSLKPGELSPDLALGASRLRRAWIRRFILEPQQVLPGTRMPNLFPLADEDDPRSRLTPQPGLLGGSVQRQVEALTELSLWWGTAEAARALQARAARPRRGGLR